MNKPAFNDLPWKVREYLWGRVEGLYYEEDSWSEFMSEVQGGYVNENNKNAMNRYYEEMDVNTLLQICADIRNEIIRESSEMNDLIKSFYQ